MKKRADAGCPIVTTLPTAPIGPHDLRPTPTGMIVVAFLNGRIPMLARTGLNSVDVRHCALGHLLSMARGKSGERYLLGGINLWLCDFLKTHRTLRALPHATFLCAPWAQLSHRLRKRNCRPALAELDSVCDARIRANVARSTFFQQCKGGKRPRLCSYLLDRPRHS